MLIIIIISLININVNIKGNNKFHNGNGNWYIEKQRLKWDVLDVFKKAAIEHGIPETFDFNTGCNNGVGYFDVTQKKGFRFSTYEGIYKFN